MPPARAGAGSSAHNKPGIVLKRSRAWGYEGALMYGCGDATDHFCSYNPPWPPPAACFEFILPQGSEKSLSEVAGSGCLSVAG